MKLFNDLNQLDTYFDYYGDDVTKRLLGSIEIKNEYDNISALSSYLFDLFGGASIFANPKDFIYSILSLPIATKYVDNDGVLKAGTAEDSVVKCRWSRHKTLLYRVGYTFYAGTGTRDFRSYNGYTKLKMHLPYFGLVDLNPNDVLGRYIHVFLVASSTTTQATYIICVSDDPYSELGSGNKNLFGSDELSNIDLIPLQYINFTLGVTLPLGNVDNASTQRNMLMSGLQIAGAIAFAKAPLPLSVSTTSSNKSSSTTETVRNPTTNRQIISNRSKYNEQYNSSRIYDNSEYEQQRRVNDIFKSSVYALNSFEQSVSTTAPASTQLMFPSSLDIHLIEYRAKVIDADLEYNHLYGRPLGAIQLLDNLRGYTIIDDVHINVDDFDEMTLIERDMLESALYDGIIL